MTTQFFWDDDDLVSERRRLDQKFGEIDWEMCTILLRRQKKYEEGDKGIVLLALWQCLGSNWPIPPWLLEAFDAAYKRHLLCETKSWDEIFGPCTRKGAQLDAMRRQWDKAEDVYYRVEELRKAGKPVNKDLFKAVGKERG
jgi:hypothetical protein